jgi:hypothetical protein
MGFEGAADASACADHHADELKKRLPEIFGSLLMSFFAV